MESHLTKILSQKKTVKKENFNKSLKNIEMKERLQTIKMRSVCTYLNYALTTLWIISLLFIIIGNGIGPLHLSEKVLLGLIGSMTVLLPLVILISKYLFNIKS
jgi:hypothetical protein